MRSRRQVSLAANPLLIGAVTTLVVVVAVYLAYNANSGLPFVPTYNIKVELPNADGLINGNDVRIGGTRVGEVADIVPHQLASGRSIAIAELKLQKGVEPLPSDTSVSVLSRSSVGLKYLALFKGVAAGPLEAGATIPLSRFREPVLLDEFFGMFDKPTRVASQENLIDGGNGFAGRGPSLNRAIRELRPLVTNAIPVLHNIAAPQTAFEAFWRDLDQPAAETAAAAQQNAGLFVDLDLFFRAWASVSGSLEAAIEGGPPALLQATHSLRFEASFTENSAEFMHLLKPSAKLLRQSARTFADAVQEGTHALPQAVALNQRLKVFLGHLREFGEDPVVELALETLTNTAALGNTLFGGLAPEQQQCNYVALTFRNIASLLSTSIGIGTLARVLPVLSPTGPNSEGVPSGAPANGPSPEEEKHHTGKYNNNFIHVNPYPNVSAPGQPRALCEAGNEVYSVGSQAIGHAAKVDHGTEATKRSESLYGQPYSAQQQKALGIAGSKK